MRSVVAVALLLICVFERSSANEVDQSGTLKITYDGGKTKAINDYGLLGTYGLERVYRILFDLRKNQNWK